MKYNNKITKTDINKVFIRSILLQGSWNFERMQALGFCYSILPILNKLYKNNNIQKKKSFKRHLEFFNTHPYMVSPILGIVIAMEEEKSKYNKIKSNSIRNIKIGLMGPLAGIGDPIFWGTIRPMLSAIGASLAINGSIIGPIFFFISFNIIRLFTLYYGLHYGYKKGINIIKELNKNFLKKITEASSILGLFVLGALVNKWTKVKTPIIITHFIKNNKNINVKLQDILDNLTPGIIPLALTLTCMWLLNKKFNPLTLMLMLLILGIICNYFRILT